MQPLVAPLKKPVAPKRTAVGKSASTVKPAAGSALPAAPAIVKSAAQKALEKLGLRRDIDLALHLPLRYED